MLTQPGMEVRRGATLNRYALTGPWLRKVLVCSFSSGERQSSLSRYANLVAGRGRQCDQTLAAIDVIVGLLVLIVGVVPKVRITSPAFTHNISLHLFCSV